jgi:phosphate:Na+ symporter
MGFILDDILTDLERVSDHCSNIAVEMITIYDNDYSTHEYFKNFSDEERAVFRREYEQLLQKYPLKKSDTKKAAKE